MSCLLLKGSSENPAPPKEEVKGPEVGGCKRGHEREAKQSLTGRQRGPPVSVHASRPLTSGRHRALLGPRGSLRLPAPPPSTAGALWPVKGKSPHAEGAEGGSVPRRLASLRASPAHVGSFLTPGLSPQGPLGLLLCSAMRPLASLLSGAGVAPGAASPLSQPGWSLPLISDSSFRHWSESCSPSLSLGCPYAAAHAVTWVQVPPPPPGTFCCGFYPPDSVTSTSTASNPIRSRPPGCKVRQSVEGFTGTRGGRGGRK